MQQCNHYNVHFKLLLSLLAFSAFCQHKRERSHLEEKEVNLPHQLPCCSPLTMSINMSQFYLTLGTNDLSSQQISMFHCMRLVLFLIRVRFPAWRCFWHYHNFQCNLVVFFPSDITEICVIILRSCNTWHTQLCSFFFQVCIRHITARQKEKGEVPLTEVTAEFVCAYGSA